MDNFSQTYQLLQLLFASDDIRLEDILFLSKNYIGDDYQLLHTYNKLKSLKNFEHLNAILEPYMDYGIDQPLPIYNQIQLYLDTVLVNNAQIIFNNTISTCSKRQDCSEKYTTKMQLHLKLAQNNDKLMELFSPETYENFVVEFGPPIIDYEKIDILSKIFSICPESVYVPEINYIKSKLLEAMVINCVIKMGYFYNSINYQEIKLIDQKQGSLDQFITNFLWMLKENRDDENIRQSLWFIKNFFEGYSSLDNQIYHDFLVLIYEWSVDIRQIDNNIIDFLNNRLKISTDLFSLLFGSDTQNQCKMATVNGLLKFHERLSTNADENYAMSKISQTVPSNESGNDREFLEFVKTFKFKNNSIITFNVTLNKIELWPLEHSKLPPVEDETEQKFAKLKNLVDYNYPFEVFEAIIICSDITTETESESLLKYVFEFDSYTCTLISAAIHYYNIGLIEFDLRKMYNYVTLLAKDKKLNSNCSRLCVLPLADKLHIKYIYKCISDKQKYRKFLSRFSDKRKIISQIIKNIRLVIESFSDLIVACSYYEIHELYIIDFILNVEIDTFSETILAIILLNSPISKYEKIFLHQLIKQNASAIVYKKISNVDLVSYFNKSYTFPTPTTGDDFIPSNIVPNDYKLILKHKNKIPNWRELFLALSSVTV